jgi:Acyl-CoA dehydrogenase, C-terminal domain
VPLADLVMQHALTGTVDPTTAVVLRRPGGPDPAAGANRGPSGVDVDGLVVGCGRQFDRLLVATGDAVVVLRSHGLARRPVAPTDPALGVLAVSGTAEIDAESALVIGSWDAALAAGRRALAAELAGIAGQMLVAARDHVLVREQFGRPIGAFQTVKHRLADVHVAIEAAHASNAAAWADGSDISAIAALCLAARAHLSAATHCHQVHGGIAFTVEHGFHRWIRRGQVLSALTGRPDDLVRSIGDRLVAEHRVPRTPDLA